MLCEHCGKRDATFHIQKIVNGKVEFKHYCAICMEKLSGTEEFDGMNLAEILMQFAGQVKDAVIQEHSAAGKEKNESVPEQENAVCPVCGWDLKRFLKTERFGCAECYQIFRGSLEEILRKYHDSLLHKGKTPAEKAPDPGRKQIRTLQQQILSLRRELDFMVEKEEYEIAAHLRDEIGRLSAELESSSENGECAHGKE